MLSGFLRRRRQGQPSEHPIAFSPEQFITALHRGLLRRDPDKRVLALCIEHLERGVPLEAALDFFLGSRDYQERIAADLAASKGTETQPYPYNPSLLNRLPSLADIVALARRPNVLFLQTADPYHYHDMLAETSRTVRHYCQRHGYRYECYIGIKRGYFSWHAAYNRIVILKELIDSGYSGWVFYLDADTVISDQDFDLAAYLQEKTKYATIFVDPGKTEAWYRINDGIFFLNTANRQARELVDNWYAEFMRLSDEELRQAIEWGDLPHDQDLLHEVLRANQEFRSSIFFESPLLLGWGPGFVRQFTRGEAVGLDERKRLIKTRVDELLGEAEAAGRLRELSERDADVIVATLYKTILGKRATWEDSHRYAAVLREDGLQYGLQRVIDSIVQSEEFKSRFAPGGEAELNYEQARMVGAALYLGLFEREPDWHALNVIPATLQEQGLAVGLQNVIADMIRSDEFRIRHEARRQAAAAPET